MNQIALTIPDPVPNDITGLSLNDNWNFNIQSELSRSKWHWGNALLLGMLMTSGITYYVPVTLSNVSIEADTLTIKTKRNFFVTLKIVNIKRGRPSICDDIEV